MLEVDDTEPTTVDDVEDAVETCVDEVEVDETPDAGTVVDVPGGTADELDEFTVVEVPVVEVVEATVEVVDEFAVVVVVGSPDWARAGLL